MKLKFDRMFRGGVVALVALLVWAVWASAQVTNAPAQLPAAGATNSVSASWLTFGLDQMDALRGELLGRPWWQYCASLLYVLLAFLVARLIDVVFCGWLRRLATKTETRFDELVIELISGPVKVVSFVILVHAGLRIFSWPQWVEVWLSKILLIVVALSLTYLVLKCTDVLMEHWKERTGEDTDKAFDAMLFPVMRKGVKAFVVVVAVLLTTHNLGLNITSLLASLSIGGLALGLAAQDTLANLFGAVAVYVDKPFRVGDRIQVEKVDGTVENIGLRSTRVRNLDGFLVTIPNKTMGSATIINVSRRPGIKSEMNLGITCDTPSSTVRRAVSLLEEVYRADPRTADLVVSFNKFTDSSLNLQVIHVWNGHDLKAHAAAMHELNLAVKLRFDGEGIRFAYPTQTLIVRQEQAGPAS